MKNLRRVGVVLGLLFALALAGLAYLSVSFDAVRVKSELARMVLEKKQRTLEIDGELSLSFWPRLEVRLGRASLSERGSREAFAALESARFSVQLMPLLSQRIVIDQAELSGVRVALLRHKDGTLNIDDLLAQGESSGVKFDIAGLKISNARLDWHDEISGGDLALTRLNLTTGHLANIAQGKLALSAKLVGSQPKIDGTIQISTIYDYDMDGRRFGVSRLDARITGLLAGLQGVELAIGAGDAQLHPRNDKLQLETLVLSARLSDAGRTIDTRLDLSGIEGSFQALRANKLDLLLDATNGPATLKGLLSSSFVANLSAQTMALPGFSGELVLAHPHMPMKQLKLPISGELRIDLARPSAEGAARTHFDESKITAEFHLTRFVPLILGFAVDIDRLNLDKYLPPRRHDGQKVAAKDRDEEFGPPALKNIQLHGTVNIDVLQFAGTRASKLRLDLTTTDGKLGMNTTAHSRKGSGRPTGR